MSLSPLNPSDIPEHIADAIRRAEVLGQPKVARAIEKAEALRQKRLGESKERKRVQDRMAQRRRYDKVKDKVKDQRKVIKRQKLEETLNSIGVDKNDFRGAELAAESVATLIGSSVSCTKNSTKSTTSSTSNSPATDTDQIGTTKTGCYLALPGFDKDYFCGWCNCGKITPWHYQLIPVSLVPFELLKNFANDINSNEKGGSDKEFITDGRAMVTVTSTTFKSVTGANASSRPAVVTPSEKTASKPSKSATVHECNEKGANAITRNADKIVAKHFNSNDPRASIFGLEISRPLGDRKISGKIAVSWYPPKYLPVFGDGSGKKRMRKEDIVGHSNHIIHVGKNIMKQSEWNVDEAEANVFGSSTKYHTLLVHDPNIAATEKAGLSIFFFKPVATKYFWLSFITSARNTRREKKEERGRGYGRMILWRLINLAQMADGIEEIYLEVNPEWKTAIDLYRSLQFEEISWDMLPKGIEAFEFEVKANEHPECKKIFYETLFKHHGEYTLMRLKLSVFG